MRTRLISAPLAALAALAALVAPPSPPAWAEGAPASAQGAPASAEAAPRLPAGWTRGAERPERRPSPPGREFGSHQSNHEFTFRARSALPGTSVDLAALPVVEIAPAAPAEALAALPAGPPGDLVVLRTRGAARVSVQGFEAGFLQVGKSLPTAVGRQSEGGAAGVCGPGAASGGIRPITYEAIRRVDPKGNLEIVWARGYLDSATCAVAIVQRDVARPQHVGGGVVYAFRTRCPGCAEGAREILHVLTPQMEDRFKRSVPFEHRTLPLAPGKSGAFEGSSSSKSPFSVGSWGLPDWGGVVDQRCKEDSVWCFKTVRLEVSQALGEAAPTVFLGGDLD